MTQKLVVSKPTFNVLTETDPDNLIFSSDYDTLKYETFGNITVTTDKADYYHAQEAGFPFPPFFYYHRTVETVAHGLGYTPHFVGYLVDFPIADDVIQAPFAFGDAGYFIYLAVYADSTYLYFLVQFNSADNSGIVETDFNYRIFKNDLGL